MSTEQNETLGAEDSKWLGEYSQVHMNVFGTPLRVMDHGQGAHIWDVDGCLLYTSPSPRDCS